MSGAGSARGGKTHGDDAYASAGVRYDVIDPGKRLAQERALATAVTLDARGISELRESRGESAYVVDVGDFYVSSVTEALGTKNLIADATRELTGRTHYDTIAQDAVATVLNDLASVGGVPMSLTAYWGTGSSDWFADAARMRDLTEGWSRACMVAGCSWGGGETQTITGIIEPNAVNLAGSAVGLIRPKTQLLIGGRIAVGDAILIAPATGLHANGATLARKIAAQLPDRYATKVPGDALGRAFGEVLLDPTPLYGPLVEALQHGGVDLHYAVHVTGHGWRKLMRAERELSYVMTALAPRLPIYDFIQRHAAMSDEAMYGTFNMGAGYALYVPESDVREAVSLAERAGFELIHAGRVHDGDKKVVIEPLGITFDGRTLQIR